MDKAWLPCSPDVLYGLSWMKISKEYSLSNKGAGYHMSWNRGQECHFYCYWGHTAEDIVGTVISAMCACATYCGFVKVKFPLFLYHPEMDPI